MQSRIEKLQALCDTGKLRQAEKLAKSLLRKTPRDIALRDTLGDLFASQGKLDDAIKLCRRTVEIDPEHLFAWRNMAIAELYLGRYEDAIAHFRAAIGIDSGIAEIHRDLAAALMEVGERDEAIAAFEEAIVLGPQSAATHAELAGLYEQRHDLEAANRHTNKALALDPDDVQANLERAIILKREGQPDAAIELLNRFAGADMPARTAARLHNVLGKLLDGSGRTDLAFASFTACNECKQQTIGSVKASRFIDELRRVNRFVAEKHSETGAEGRFDGDSPVFVVGFPRSGTTLVGQILDSHPALQLIEEKPLMMAARQYGESKTGKAYPAMLDRLDPRTLEHLRVAYEQAAEKYVERTPDTRRVDKMPLNISYLPLIARMFPDARIVFVMRHPCDAVLSCFMQNFRINDAMANFLTLEDTAHCYDEVMRLWQTCADTLELNVHLLGYESLITDLKKNARHLLEFIGVDWDERVLAYHVHARDEAKARSPSYQDVTQPVYSRSNGRWKRYEAYFEPVMGTLAPWIDAFGYDAE